MSSATSIDPTKPVVKRAVKPVAAAEADPGLRPWQFFVLAGMLSATAVVVATGQSPAAIIVLSLTVLAASLVAIAVYRALVPLVKPETIEAPQLLGGRTRAALEREKTLVLRSIKELEFDFAMKKTSQSDFDEMSGRLRARALGLMRQLDAGAGYRDTIEQELDKRLGKKGAPAETAATEPIHDAAAAPDLACAACGQTNDRDARFCKQCGTKLSE